MHQVFLRKLMQTRRLREQIGLHEHKQLPVCGGINRAGLVPGEAAISQPYLEAPNLAVWLDGGEDILLLLVVFHHIPAFRITSQGDMGTSLIRNSAPLGPYRSPLLMDLW